MRIALALFLVVVLPACSGAAGRDAARAVARPPTTGIDVAPPVEDGAPPPPVPAPAPSDSEEPVVVRYRVEDRTGGAAGGDFAAFVDAVLSDPRGWEQARFDLVHDPAAEHLVVLAEGPEVDALCLPYDTGGRFSCQNGPVVALNADRWRSATDTWPGTLQAYRTMLVNHEVGHLLGMHHIRCKGEGLLAPVMEQQSARLGGCMPNPWPTPLEIALAATHQFRIAPPPLDT